MKKLLVTLVCVLILSAVFSQSDSLYIGWYKTEFSTNRAQMILSRGAPYSVNRLTVLNQFHLLAEPQPADEGILVLPLKRKKDNKTFYFIFCKYWYWEYVTVLSFRPSALTYSRLGDLHLQYDAKKVMFNRVVYVASPGVVRWQESLE